MSNNARGSRRTGAVSSSQKQSNPPRTGSRYEKSYELAGPRSSTARGTRQTNGQTHTLETIEIDSDHDINDAAFTKDARKERRHRDALLSSSESPAVAPATLPPAKVVSEYFTPHSNQGTPANSRTPAPRRQEIPAAISGADSSPDALQADTHMPPQPTARGKSSLPQGPVVAMSHTNGGDEKDQFSETANGASTGSHQKDRLPDRARRSASGQHIYPLEGLRCGNLADYDAYVLEIDGISRTFSINTNDDLLTSTPIQAPRNLTLMEKFWYAGEPGTKMVIFLRSDYTDKAIKGRQIGLHFKTRKPLSGLAIVLQELGVTGVEKEL